MIRIFFYFLFFQLVLSSCKKNDTLKSNSDAYITYLIKKGEHYATNNNLTNLSELDTLKYLVVFDSSCIYQNMDTQNQYDINKLIGFSDCGTLHQENSARFGWNWLNGSIHLYAYCYNNGERKYEFLDTVELNKPYYLKLYLDNFSYYFFLKDKIYTMPRACSNGNKINGYQLFPYFGGDEVAPHDIRIKIKYL